MRTHQKKTFLQKKIWDKKFDKDLGTSFKKQIITKASIFRDAGIIER